MKMSKEWLKQLQDEISSKNIRIGTHPFLPLKIYNYTSQVQFSENWNKITRVCRGLVLDNNGNVVILPPPKFFNKGEKFATPIDLSSARISEKLDGMMIMVKADTDWGLIVTSRGSFDNKYVEATKKFLTDDVILKLIPNYTYFCELLQNFPGDESIILTQHPIPKLVCWAIKDDQFNEIIPDEECPFPIAKELSLAEAKEYLKQKVEGVVAQDLTTKERVKIKTEYFIEHHRMIANCTKKRVWEILSNYQKIEDFNIPDEFMARMKEYEAELGREFQAIWRRIQDADSETSHLTDKELGLLDKYQDIKSDLFLLRKDKEFECLDRIWKKIKPRNVV